MSLDRLTAKQFSLFRDFIYQNSGIHVDERKVTLLSNRIRRRLRAGDFPDFDAYYRYLTSADGKGEVTDFLDAVTTNETFFFRGPNQFNWLRGDWIAEQVAEHRAGKRPARLKLLSAACANGAEAYSMAICLAENAFRLRDWSVDILGIDISEEMLRVAREGSYRERVMNGVSEQQRKRYFSHQPNGNLWKVKSSIKQNVRFKKHNLMDPLNGGPFDLIFIRNVLIYFDRQSKQTVVKHLMRQLSSGGHLVVGPSEGIHEWLGDLTRVSPLIYRKPNRVHPRTETSNDE